jgi:hypothetical protein
LPTFLTRGAETLRTPTVAPDNLPKFSEVLQTWLELREAGEPTDGSYKAYWKEYYALLATMDALVHGTDCN